VSRGNRNPRRESNNNRNYVTVENRFNARAETRYQSEIRRDVHENREQRQVQVFFRVKFGSQKQQWKTEQRIHK